MLKVDGSDRDASTRAAAEEEKAQVAGGGDAAIWQGTARSRQPRPQASWSVANLAHESASGAPICCKWQGGGRLWRSPAAAVVDAADCRGRVPWGCRRGFGHSTAAAVPCALGVSGEAVALKARRLGGNKPRERAQVPFYL